MSHHHLAALVDGQDISAAGWIERWQVIAEVKPDTTGRRAPWATDQDARDWNAWKVRLAHIDGGPMLALSYFTGSHYGTNGREKPAQPVPPTVEDIVWTLAMDVQTVGSYGIEGFEEWAADLGENPDSRRAEAIFRATVEEVRRIEEWAPTQAFRELRDHVRDE